MATLTYTDTLQVIECGSCHVSFAMPKQMHQQVQRDGSWFWCPKGCRIHYFDDENTRLKAELDRAKADAEWQRKRKTEALAEAQHLAAVARGYKGAAVKAKKRAARGVCPAPGCKRSFVDVARHVTTCHPELTTEVTQ